MVCKKFLLNEAYSKNSPILHIYHPVLSKNRRFFIVIKSTVYILYVISHGWQKQEQVFFKVEKNMFVTPVFYLGAERSRFTIALQYRSCELVNLFPRGLPEIFASLVSWWRGGV